MNQTPPTVAAAGEPQGSGDLFVFAFEEYEAALDEVTMLKVEYERALLAMPEEARREPRALMGIVHENGQTVPVYAVSHDEIDQVMDGMEAGVNLNADTDQFVVLSLRLAIHEAFDTDEEQLRGARQEHGIADLSDRYHLAEEGLRDARNILLSIVPTSPQGCAWLAYFVHSQANNGGSVETIAKAARNLAEATSAIAFGQSILPSLH